MTTSTPPYRICDDILLQCNTVYDYMLIAVKVLTFTHIDKTMSMRIKIQQHNSNVGAAST